MQFCVFFHTLFLVTPGPVIRELYEVARSRVCVADSEAFIYKYIYINKYIYTYLAKGHCRKLQMCHIIVSSLPDYECCNVWSRH